MNLMPTLIAIKHLGPAVQWIEAELCLIFNSCIISGGHITGCVTVNLRSCLR